MYLFLHNCKNCSFILFAQTACQNGHFECVSYLLNKILINGKIRVNLRNNDGFSPIMKAVQNGHYKTVSVLCKSPKIKILDVHALSGMNAIDFSVYFGQVSIFCKLLLTLFERYNINSIDDLNNNKYIKNIFEPININKWLKWCEREQNFGMHSFILKRLLKVLLFLLLSQNRLQLF